jgi:alanyl-tRNA synthetase
VVTIELATRELTDQQIESVEERANELASEARVVAIAFEEAEQAAGLRKASGRTGMLRVVDIAGVDRSACGGTHVRSTAETVPIQIRKLERVRGNVRLELVCGGRARRRARQDYRVVAELARQSASSIEKLPEHIASLRQRALDAEKRNQALGLELAARDGRELYAAAKAGSDGVRRAKLAVGSLDERTRAVSQAFIEQAGAAVILVRAEQPRGVLIACSRDSGLDAGAILKRVVAAAGGRGGGSATLAQGSLPDGLGNREIEVALEEALGFSLAESGKPEEHGAA